ncbi:MAG TPA: sigma-70 family RNA polymerase sigma factor [Candidatus Limnocylindria bacterium]|jgi:RNA polymerase sigma-70 factor (ECF subfamily)|nr:sigma-70 family RNA polymerase sigma factor [Candidatus Limnocylindria bacterium]
MWSAILTAADADMPRALEALERLAKAYWRPLYVFVRQRGVDHDTAADQVQGFFAYLLSRDFLQDVRPGEGRFRNFLLVGFRRWIRDQRDREFAQKRGGGIAPVPLQELEALRMEPVSPDSASAENAFERAWAQGLVARSLDALEVQWSARAALFAALRLTLEGSPEAENYAVIGIRLGMTEGAVKKAAYDLRQQFSTRIRAEIRATVQDDAEVEPELRHLIGLLRG